MTPEEMLIRAEVAMEWRKEVARAVAEERERCARIAEEYRPAHWERDICLQEDIAAAIRGSADT
jgi:hypothetical protein